MPEREVRRVARPVFTRPSRPSSPLPIGPKRKWWWVKYAVVAIGLILVWRAFAINQIQISGQQTIDPKAIELSVTKGIDHQLLGGSLLTLSSGRLSGFVIGEIPEIRQLVIKRRFPHTLTVQVFERDPSLAWQSGGILYLLDRDGTAIRPITDKLARLPVVVDTTNLPIKTGDRVAPTRFVTFALAIAADLPQKGLPIKNMTITESTSELTVNLQAGYAVKFDTTGDEGVQVGELQKVVSYLRRTGQRAHNYIDLRVAGRAYYK